MVVLDVLAILAAISWRRWWGHGLGFVIRGVAGVVALPYIRNMTTATVTSKGQVTIPAGIRRKLRLLAGSKIDFIENKAGEMVIRAKTGDIRELYGFVKYHGAPLTIEQMNEAIGNAAVEHFKLSHS